MEVLTLQIGHFANHVGAHFWNFQDEIGAREAERASNPEVADVDFNRLYRQVEHRGGTVLQPRLLVVDSKGALGAYRPGMSQAQRLAALEAVQAGGLWQGAVENHESEQVSQHPFQADLEQEEEMAWGASKDGANDEADEEEEESGAMKRPEEYDFANSSRTWTDFFKVSLPESSIHELQGWHHNVSVFAFYFDGLQAKGRSDEDHILDGIRRQVEQCDHPDGVHVIYDVHNGFSGLTHLAFEWLAEEMPKNGKLGIAVQPMASPDAACSSGLDEGLSVAALDAHAASWLSSAFSFAGAINTSVQGWVPTPVPLWSPGKSLSLKKTDSLTWYEASSLVAAGWQTASLPYTLMGGLGFSDLLSKLTPTRRPTLGMLLALPLPMPQVANPSAPSEHLAGIMPCAWNLSGIEPGICNPFTNLSLTGTSPQRLVGLCDGLHPQARHLSFAHALPLPIPLPFPQLFNTNVTSAGLWDPHRNTTARDPAVEVFECPTLSILHAASEGGRCKPLAEMVKVLKTKRHSNWMSSVMQRYGLETDEIEDVLSIVTEQLEASGCGAEGSNSDVSDMSDT